MLNVTAVECRLRASSKVRKLLAKPGAGCNELHYTQQWLHVPCLVHATLTVFALCCMQPVWHALEVV